MRIVDAAVYCLNIPFKSAFRHALKERSYSDSIVVKLTSDSGTTGYGEGIARPYVTGETVEKCTGQLARVLLPALIDRDIGPIRDITPDSGFLDSINNLISDCHDPAIPVYNGAKTAMELALIDCILKDNHKSLNCVLPAKSQSVSYSGILTAGTVAQTIQLAKRIKEIGFQSVKMKVGHSQDSECVAAARDILGPTVSLRLDANGAFGVKQACAFIESVQIFDIASLEQPVRRGNIADLIAVKSNSPIAIMADESLVTLDDAKRLIDYNACDCFNLRIAKCGGMYNTLAIAALANRAGMKFQLGCLVGETAILSAAGRHWAAHCPEVMFVEGSYGAHLLIEDIARETIMIGERGQASVLTGDGLGVAINDDLLKKYAITTIPVAG